MTDRTADDKQIEQLMTDRTADDRQTDRRRLSEYEEGKFADK